MSDPNRGTLEVVHVIKKSAEKGPLTGEPLIIEHIQELKTFSSIVFLEQYFCTLNLLTPSKVFLGANRPEILGRGDGVHPERLPSYGKGKPTD